MDEKAGNHFSTNQNCLFLLNDQLDILKSGFEIKCLQLISGELDDN